MSRRIKSSSTLTRRALLRGSAGLIALPLLPSWSRAAAPNPKRFVAIYQPGGVLQRPQGSQRHNVDEWTPQHSGGQLTKLGATLAAAQPHIQDILQISNTKWGGYHEGRTRLGQVGAIGHIGEHPAYLTGSCLVGDPEVPATWKTLETDDASIDRKIASISGKAPLTLGVSPYTSWQVLERLSWQDHRTGIARTQTPDELFAKVYGDPSGDVEGKAAIDHVRRSILDGAVEDIQSLKTKINASDKRHLDDYLTRLREAEQNVGKILGGQCAPPDAPAAVDTKQYAELMVDLALLALQCDATRVVTLSIWPSGGGVGRNCGQYIAGISPENVSLDFHRFTHHSTLTTNVGDTYNTSLLLDDFRRSLKWSAGLFTRFIEGLKGATDPDGSTMLYNSLIMYGSMLGDGDHHEYSRCARVVAGQCGGAVKTGRLLDGGGQYIDNILPEILSLFDYKRADGSEQTKVGVSNGRLSLR
ncbi:MAG: DUF1552 domain-containing protein [Myxococcales bacterium]|nr:DUF1552 domain-containing protein [Myxococcales bacterium]